MPIAPTLSAMAEIYKLSREGGPKSARFTTYVKLVPDTWELAGWNPMAGPQALDAVNALMTMDAEGIALEAQNDVRSRCAFHGDVTLAIVLASAGMWTDRMATEIGHRTALKRLPGRGGILLWTREPITARDVQREAMAEAVRVMWTTLHGEGNSAGKVLAREGLAYAPLINPFAAPVEATDDRVGEALSVLGDTRTLGDIVSLLYGDEIAARLGYGELGLPDRAGLRWGAMKAEACVAELGGAEALRKFANACQPGLNY